LFFFGEKKRSVRKSFGMIKKTRPTEIQISLNGNFANHKAKIKKNMKRLFFVVFVLLGVFFVSCDRKVEVPEFADNTFFRVDADDEVFYFKQTRSEEGFIEGVFFKLTDQEEADFRPFSVKFGSKRCTLVVDADEHRNLKYRLSNDGDETLKGWVDMRKRKVKFTITRYKEPEFTAYNDLRFRRECSKITVTPDVVYANVQGYWDSYPDQNESYFKVVRKGLAKSVIKHPIDLGMDIYMPANDTLARRPLLMMIHGGGFYIGNKEAWHIVMLSEHFAKMGYVVASINYRIGFKPSKKSVERTGYQAVQDAHAAMRYLVANRDLYGIDTSLIFVAGTSAGGITALNLCFMNEEFRPKSTYSRDDLGTIESSGNDYTDKFKIKAVANMWGAVHDINMIRNVGTAIISFHGDADQTVPAGHDYPFKDFKSGLNEFFFEKTYGSLSIDQRAKEMGVKSELHLFKGAGHSLYLDEATGGTSDRIYTIEDKMGKYFFDFMVPERARILKTERPQFYELMNSGLKYVSWSVEGGIVVESDEHQIRVVWLPDAEQKSLAVSGKYPNGLGFFRKIKID